MAALLNAHPALMVAAQAASVKEAIPLARAVVPDVVVLSVTLPGIEGGPPCPELLKAIPNLKIVALSERGWDRCMVLNPPFANELPVIANGGDCRGATDCLHLAASQGALGTVRRSADPAALYAAILDVALGRQHFEPGTAQALARAADGGPDQPRALSKRELEVVALIAQGRSNKEIASALTISEATVKKHVGHALAKLGLLDRLQIGLFVARHPLILQTQHAHATETHPMERSLQD